MSDRATSRKAIFIAAVLTGIPVVMAAAPAHAQQVPSPVSLEPANGDWKLTVGGWVDAYIGYNFNDPATLQSQARAFDSRHESFAVQVAALDVGFESRSSVGTALVRVTVQAGDQPDQYYRRFGSERPSDAIASYESFRHVQQAFGGYKIDVPGAGEQGTLQIDAGIFPSHLGYETLNAKDNIHFSRSLLFQLAPLYATGVRATYTVSSKFNAQLSAVNGWNSVYDNNRSKTLAARLEWTPNDRVSGTVNWIGGAEQDAAISMRNLFEGIVTVKPFPKLEVTANGLVGFDKVNAGTTLNGAIVTADTRVSWYGVAGYARYQIADTWAGGLRAEVFRDENGVPWELGTAATVWEGTATIEKRPLEHLIVRLELRHDHADAPLYDLHTPLAIGKSQTTLTLAGIAFF